MTEDTPQKPTPFQLVRMRQQAREAMSADEALRHSIETGHAIRYTPKQYAELKETMRQEMAEMDPKDVDEELRAFIEAAPSVGEIPPGTNEYLAAMRSEGLKRAAREPVVPDETETPSDTEP